MWTRRASQSFLDMDSAAFAKALGLALKDPQYQRRNSLRIAGFPEDENEDILTRTLELMNTTMSVEPAITAHDVDRIHRVGKKDGGKPRSVIIKFATYRARHRVMQHRRNLRNTTHFINEDLTRVRSTLLYKSRLMKRQGHFKDCWTHDGSIVYKDNAETWLTSNNKDNYDIPDYNSIHSVRTERRGGGVSLFIISKFEFKPRPDLDTFNDDIESLFIEIPTTHLLTEAFKISLKYSKGNKA
ncbi:hypothetical protein CAPTEDRAFT_206629 [Capitella teleta]|uniref:Uncharacterized protein n=1 Tax=Capitella teleta TaxID=283909 RepID=R7VGC9_CAPTE|nr:hypothetical protein CAPTEDRAFT_206629 [Capitella teleta]|eukprot:ELU17627.1 hypothetical protein CAPTEDRAFT_206629 [Capitella teleta]